MGNRAVLGLTVEEAQAGVRISEMREYEPDSSGVGPSLAVITFTAFNLEPLNPGYVLTGYPGPVSQGGSDSSGIIGVQGVYSNTGNDIDYLGSVSPFLDGFFQGVCVIFINAPSDVGIYFNINVSYDGTDVTGYDPILSEDPYNLTEESTTFDPDLDKAIVEFSFTYDNTLSENPDGFSVWRNGAVVGSIARNPASHSYTYIDSIYDASGTYTYKVAAYLYAGELSSDFSNTFDVDFSASTPDIDIIGSGGFAFGGSATIVFIADPSGLYTLVRNKTCDTLYDRDNNSTMDVKIPDPFIKTGFIGG